LPDLFLKGREVARLNADSADLVPPIRETEPPLPRLNSIAIYNAGTCAIFLYEGCLGTCRFAPVVLLSRPAQLEVSPRRCAKHLFFEFIA
jgi:hypothetical protein